MCSNILKKVEDGRIIIVQKHDSCKMNKACSSTAKREQKIERRTSSLFLRHNK